MSMENRANSGFNVSDKISSNLDGSDGVGLGLKLQSIRSLPSKIMMGHHHYHLHRLLLSTVACCGPTCNHSGANEVVMRAISQISTSACTNMSNIYGDVVVGPLNEVAVFVRTLQPFDISNYTSTTAFKSPGGMAAAKVEFQFPFTSAQWKELERQAMIYKYMMASMPVPPDLLLPLTRSFPADPSTTWRYTNSKDSEPGRCKRTDGKKWRCSREVAPNQKYCERHMHRGRPRSRKPVEVHAPLNNNNNNNNKKTRLNNIPPSNTAAATVVADPIAQPNSSQPHQMLGTNLVFPETDTDFSIKAYTNRDRGWVTEDKMVGIHGVQQQWSHLMDTNIGLASEGSIYDSNASLFHQYYKGGPLNLFSYTDLAASGDVQRTDEYQFLLNSDLVSLEKQHQIDQPRGFIDAWSNDNYKTTTNATSDTSVSLSQRNLSPSSLTLSMAMAAGNALDEEMGNIQEGGCVDDKPKDSSWMSSTPCWLPFARGGPLAEVLHTGSVAIPSNPASPYISYGDSISPPATTVSSPSGVLQRGFFSQSDCSVCNSPIVSAPMGPNEVVAFQWLN